MKDVVNLQQNFKRTSDESKISCLPSEHRSNLVVAQKISSQRDKYFHTSYSNSLLKKCKNIFNTQTDNVESPNNRIINAVIKAQEEFNPETEDQPGNKL